MLVNSPHYYLALAFWRCKSLRISYLPYATSMSPPVSYAKAELGYPIFSAEFDPYNRGYLVVGGGGGENKAGIANKIVRGELFLLHEPC